MGKSVPTDCVSTEDAGLVNTYDVTSGDVCTWEQANGAQ